MAEAMTWYRWPRPPPEGQSSQSNAASGFDASVLTLLLSNLFTICVAVYESWHLPTVMFAYWFQSVTIGVFTALRMLTLTFDDLPKDALEKIARFRDMKPEALEELRKRGVEDVPPPGFDMKSGFTLVKLFLAGFFAVHYGGFHYGYFEFIGHSVDFNAPGLLTSCGVFFANHMFSFLYNLANKRFPKENLGEIMFMPYMRIIPMHTTIVVGMFVFIALKFIGVESETPILVFFLLLKTYSDVLMHAKKHETTKASGAGLF